MKRTISNTEDTTDVSTRDDKRGFGGGNALDFTISGKSIKRLALKAGESYTGDIVPFVAKSVNNPMVHNGKLKLGDITARLDIWIHTKIGPSRADIVCESKNYGLKCYVCEQEQLAWDKFRAGTLDKETAKAFMAKRRVFYNWRPSRRGEVSPMMYMNEAHFTFMNPLVEKANLCEDGAPPVPYNKPYMDGRKVKFRCITGSLGGKHVECRDFEFLARDVEVSDADMDNAISFDALIVRRPYEEQKAIVDGTADVGESADYEEEHEGAETSQQAPTTTRVEAPLTSKDAVSDNPPIDFEPKASERPTTKTPAVKAETNGCPNGKTFGKDYDFDPKVCGKCPLWESCLSAQ